MHIALLRAFFLPFCVLLPLNASGQLLPFHTYTAKDGLTRNDVRALCQDSRGFLWLGTTEGLNRYDGVAFDSFTLPEGIRGNFINSLVADSNGVVWVASNFVGLARCRDGEFTVYRVNPQDPLSNENRVNTIAPEGNRKLLIGTDAGLFEFDGFAFSRMVPQDTLLRYNVTSILRDRYGYLWVGTVRGLCRLSFAASVAGEPLDALRGMEVRQILEDARRRIWIATDRGIRLVPPDAGKEIDRAATHVPSLLQSLATKSTLSLFIDSRKTMWFGTESDGVYKLTIEGRLSHYSVDNGLPSNKVRSILEDKEQNIWFATAEGLVKLSGDNLVNFTLSGGLAHSPITSIVQDNQQRYWFGTGEGLGMMVSGRFSSYSMTNGLGSDYVLSLFRDDGGNLWVGTANGVSRLESGEGGDRFVTYRNPASPSDAVVRCIAQGEMGGIWLGTSRGFSHFRGNRWSDVSLDGDSSRSHLVICILRDLEGCIWVGTQGDGLFRFAVQPGSAGRPVLTRIAHLRMEDGLVDENIRSGFLDREGSLWFGTRFGGVTRISLRGREIALVERFTVDQGLSGNWVKHIMQDRRGNIWFATNRGADRLSRDSAGSIAIKSFTIKDGLAGDEVFACYEDKQGDIWFGSTNGATRYSPAGERPGTIPPTVLIRKVQILGREDAAALQALHADLQHDQHSLAFDYASISFRDESRVRYRYRLDGLDTAWGAETDRRYVSYTHLPPGGYRFAVMARNGDGVWTKAPATFSFTIAEPFWQTWWFILLCTCFASLSIYAMHRYRVQKLLELERVRERIAADLHDEIGSTLSSISIFSEMARQEVMAVSPGTTHYLSRIGEISRAALESFDDIVWAINPANETLYDLLLRVREFAFELFEAQGIDFIARIPRGTRTTSLPMDTRRQLYLVCKEALTNVAKHSRCQHATLELLIENTLLTLTVRDDGAGFRLGSDGHGNGLINLRKRAAAVGGTLTVESEETKGTTVRLQLRIT